VRAGVSDQLQHFAGARDDALVEAGTDGISALGSSAAKEGKKGMPAPFDIARFAGILAPLARAVGASATAVVVRAPHVTQARSSLG
jgi:hypothetical protein